MGNGAAHSVAGWFKAVTIGRKPGWTLVRIAVLVVLTWVAFRYVIVLRKIESTSMLPTLREGTVHVINRLAYSPGRPPQRGDIVGVRTSGETIMYVKRVVGLPGESVGFREGRVVVDGQPLDEPYLRLPARPWNRAPRRLDSNQFFVVGDNRTMSQEQHEFGAIDRSRIVGKVVW